MTLSPDWNEQFAKAIEATKPEKLQPLSIEQLEKYCAFFEEIRSYLSDRSLMSLCTDRMALIRKEIELRRMESRSERQHAEAIALGKKTLDASNETLSWTKIVAGIAVVGIVTTVILGIVQIWSSNTEPSTSIKPSQKSSPQMITPISESPAAEATASISTAPPQSPSTKTP